jgi:hypothetical protein
LRGLDSTNLEIVRALPDASCLDSRCRMRRPEDASSPLRKGLSLRLAFAGGSHCVSLPIDQRTLGPCAEGPAPVAWASHSLMLYEHRLGRLAGHPWRISAKRADVGRWTCLIDQRSRSGTSRSVCRSATGGITRIRKGAGELSGRRPDKSSGARLVRNWCDPAVGRVAALHQERPSRCGRPGGRITPVAEACRPWPQWR